MEDADQLLLKQRALLFEIKMASHLLQQEIASMKVNTFTDIYKLSERIDKLEVIVQELMEKLNTNENNTKE